MTAMPTAAEAKASVIYTLAPPRSSRSSLAATSVPQDLLANVDRWDYKWGNIPRQMFSPSSRANQ